jgi:hypothetical protein
MSADTPFKKPAPERIRPLRGAHTAHRRPESAARKKPRSSGVLTSTEDIMMEAVKLGYKIADEQILKGQDFARRVRGASLRSDAGDIGDLVDHALRLARQFAILLVEMGETTAQAPAIAKAWAKYVNEGEGTSNAQANAAASVPSAAQQVPLAHTVPIEVQSIRRTLVSLVLYAKPTTLPIVYPLYPKGQPGKPPLQGVSFRELKPNGGYALSIVVPSADVQPAGIYLGYVINEADDVPLGTITVTIEEG